MAEEQVKPRTRFAGADWATELKEIHLIGVGGIGSWVALNLSRIGHDLIIQDHDNVDESNVTGGQLYRNSDIGKPKVASVQEICREFGCINPIESYDWRIEPEYEEERKVVITGLDNMKAREIAFNAWVKLVKGLPPKEREDCLFMDGRLLMECYEVLTIKGNNEDQIKTYKEDYIYPDEEIPDLPCATKQSTFAAMGIASTITATLCNWAVNRRLKEEFREVPFYQRMYLPLMKYDVKEVLPEATVKLEMGGVPNKR